MKRSSRPLAVATVAAGLLAATPLAAPATQPACHRFAAVTGSNANAGTASAPFRTPGKLAAALSPGQTGCLRGGTYGDTSGGYVLDLDEGGAPGAPITIRSHPGERAKLVGIVHVPRTAPFVRLSRLDIEGTGGANTIKVYAAEFVLEDSDVTNRLRGNSCMILGSTSGYGQATRPIIRRNRFHDCGSAAHDNKDHAIYLSSVSEGQIVDNVFWNTQAYAIQLYPNAQRTRVAHNVIDGASSERGGVVVGGDSDHTSAHNVVEQNVIAFAETYNVASSWEDAVGAGNVVRQNCLWGGREGNLASARGFVAQANVVANPRYLDRVRKDFQLRPGSACLRVVGYDTVAKHGLHRRG